MSHPRVLSSISTNEFMASPAAQGRSELVRGTVRPVPASTGTQSKVSGNLTRLLAEHVERKKLGRCFDDTTQFELPNVPATVRSYLDQRLSAHPERDAILALAESLLTGPEVGVMR